MWYICSLLDYYISLQHNRDKTKPRTPKGELKLALVIIFIFDKLRLIPL